MTEPTISILIPTRGTGDLPWVAHSITTQRLIPGDEVLIIGDGRQVDVHDMISALGNPFRYVETAASGDWGHTQLNYGLSIAKGAFIMGTDDDDGYLPRAIETVRAHITASPSKPHLFRFFSNTRHLFWDINREGQIIEGMIGGHSLVLPNLEDHKGSFTPRYRGDFDWIVSVLDSYPKRDWVWCREILTRQRPDKKLLDWPVSTDDQFEALRLLRNESRLDLTRHRDVILPDEQAAFASRLRDGSVKGWAYLYTERGHLTSDYVGWSFTQVLDGKRYPSYGVSPSYQGRGFGRWIVQHTLDATMGDAYGEAFLRNEAILHLDKSLGWLETGRHDSPHGEIVDLFRPYP